MLFLLVVLTEDFEELELRFRDDVEVDVGACV